MDPRSIGPQERKANLSRLMVSLGRASAGEKVNFCPFGCQLEDLDDLGFCYHVIGFTIPGTEKFYEPLKDPDAGGRRIVDGTAKFPVLKTDQLERITCSCRVYRDIPRPPWAVRELDESELEAATRP
jgi:hypothetical protein